MIDFKPFHTTVMIWAQLKGVNGTNSLKESLIGRASIPSLFLRFVLILKVYTLEKIIVLISKKCPYF